MSIVTVQIGQCGNQIGGQLFSTIKDDIGKLPRGFNRSQDQEYKAESLERFFDTQDTKDGSTKDYARAVMVDMEPKVIMQTMSGAQKCGTWAYPPKQQFCQKRGSGNNWAHGYHVHGSKTQEPVIDMVRLEVEKCDYFGGFLTLQSLAGGTGSGVGAKLVEALREEFSHSLITNQVVLPYSTGEVCTQSYNAVLTLSHLYQSSDAIILMQNDALHTMCQRRLGLSKVSFKDINGVIAHQLATTLQPAYMANGGSKLLNNPLASLVEHVSSHPSYKLLTLRSIPLLTKQVQDFSNYTWPGLLKHLRQMMIANTAMEEGIDWHVRATPSQQAFSHSVSNLLVLRGGDIGSADVSSFRDSCLYPSWLPPAASFQSWQQPRPIDHYEKCAILVNNGQLPVSVLDQTVAKAWAMFASRAFVHQYLRYGLAEEDFVDSFACLEQVLANYKSL